MRALSTRDMYTAVSIMTGAAAACRAGSSAVLSILPSILTNFDSVRPSSSSSGSSSSSSSFSSFFSGSSSSSPGSSRIDILASSFASSTASVIDDMLFRPDLAPPDCTAAASTRAFCIASPHISRSFSLGAFSWNRRLLRRRRSNLSLSVRCMRTPMSWVMGTDPFFSTPSGFETSQYSSASSLSSNQRVCHMTMLPIDFGETFFSEPLR
mmetsp:Transcript_69664/g.155269  ORF Transcript_69664/g.155269 Transcript_69664/m.155269 type:complete len:210 (-) Transcript_69664:475-1104(-)